MSSKKIKQKIEKPDITEIVYNNITFFSVERNKYNVGW